MVIGLRTAIVAILICLALFVAGLFVAYKAAALETYWTLPPGSCVGHDCIVPMDDDLLNMDAFRNSLILYQDSNKIIIVACMEETSIRAFLAETDGAPLTPDTAEAMHIGAYYLGKTFADIFTKYPELAGMREIETEDGTIMVQIVEDKHFRGCQ